MISILRARAVYDGVYNNNRRKHLLKFFCCNRGRTFSNLLMTRKAL